MDCSICVAIGALHLGLCPFTKVEESFNTQAAHDILYHAHNITKYDHFDFPGVVPRSFLGPLSLSALSYPIIGIVQLFQCSKIWSQYIVRLILLMSVLTTWSRLRETLRKVFGEGFVWWFTLVTVSQFHFMFYSSRPLPNIVALPLVLLAVNYWMQGNHNSFILSAGAAIVIFRAEIAMLLGQFLIYDVYAKRISIPRLLKLTIGYGVLLILLTLSFDSMMWSRLTWPEAEVFWFNTIMNKSSQWGTSPFLWYWYSALPRGLGPSILLVPLGAFFDRRSLAFLVPSAIFVLLFSCLPHKELRFIIYVFPFFNIAIAAACNFFWERRRKSLIHKLCALGSIGTIVGNILISVSFLSVAIVNYPGGVAIGRLHELLQGEPFINVHIGNLAAQTGVTRFTQLNDNWIYSKKESLTPDQLQSYTHLLIEGKTKYSPSVKPFIETHKVLDVIDSFSHIAFNYHTLPPIKIKTKPAIFILERKNWRENPFGDGLPPLEYMIEEETPEQNETLNHPIVEDEAVSEDQQTVQEILETPELETTEIVQPEITLESEPNLPESAGHIRENIKNIIEKYKDSDNSDNLQPDGETSDGDTSILDRPLRKRRWGRERAKRNIAASAKQRLKELILKHKNETKLKEEEIVEETLNLEEMFTVEEELESVPEVSLIIDEEDKENDLESFLKSHSVQDIEDIVDEVIKKLEEKNPGSDDVKNIDQNEREMIRKIVEDVINEKYISIESISNRNKTKEEDGYEMEDPSEVLNEEL